MFGKPLLGVATLLLLLSLGLSKVNAQSVVVPNANEFEKGNINNSLPISQPLPLRYQQIYESTQFLQCGKRFRIIQVNFRLDDTVVQPPINTVTIPDILIQLSTTTATPTTLSTTFASNIGNDVATVFNGDLTLSAAACTTGPCPFDIMINLQAPFNYNPSKGNLLLDVTKQESPELSFFDAEGPTSVMARVFNVENPNSETGTDDHGVGVGLVTQFVCESIPVNVPTLSEWGLIAMAGILGIVGFMFLRRRKATS